MDQQHPHPHAGRERVTAAEAAARFPPGPSTPSIAMPSSSIAPAFACIFRAAASTSLDSRAYQYAVSRPETPRSAVPAGAASGIDAPVEAHGATLRQPQAVAPAGKPLPSYS